ncbi:GNAT family N-acetyltransferase [Actinospica sp. MGRD01-02]|uniref:GNAT family N-acetyltransferase n=1 Tax=Actinospica acidithermotolerans TaxID=2828514 RepID=A0A941EAH8_9ACTN|nr:GNAT family N-acetyltransferase [Actinospica acidithermotolerans]MBR7829235.1 GNAT family N-acetyltransferase [Actinospica acidithermotolerans]
MSTMTLPAAALTASANFVHLEAGDPLAVELAASFLAEESARGGAAAARYLESDPREYETWLGGAWIGLRQPDGSPAAGAAYRRYDPTTAELAQLWTRPELRRNGVARKVLAHLEFLAERSGYDRLYAVAEPGHDVLREFLRAAGYQALGDESLEYLGFVKALPRSDYLPHPLS